jgi:hypothetical protein
MRHAMIKTTNKHDGAKWRCLNRLVRWGGFEMCWIGMLVSIFLNERLNDAGCLSIVVAGFSWLLGYGTGYLVKSNDQMDNGE